MMGKEYELFKIIKPYLCIKNGEAAIKEDAPEEVKRAYEEYLSIPSEPEVY